MIARTAVGGATALVVVTFVWIVLARGSEMSGHGQDQGHAKRDEMLARIRGAEAGHLADLTDEAIARALPKTRFSTLRFRRYPVAQAVAAPLKSSNLILEPENGQVELISEASLESAFRKALAPVKNDSQAETAVKAWLRLTEALRQDGYYKFSIPEDSVKVASQDGKRVARGKLVVTPGGGGKGEINATLTFDGAGKLVKLEQTGKVLPGVRPICQSTKLLDPDPIVRQMAERDILVMGRSAEIYLAEQRALAPKELRQAIDRLWKQILDEGW
jgi:hypothetical protein